MWRICSTQLETVSLQACIICETWALTNFTSQVQHYWQACRTGTHTLLSDRHKQIFEVRPNRKQPRAVKIITLKALLCEISFARAITPFSLATYKLFGTDQKTADCKAHYLGTNSCLHLSQFLISPGCECCMSTCTCVQSVQSALLWWQGCTLWCIDLSRSRQHTLLKCLLAQTRWQQPS